MATNARGKFFSLLLLVAFAFASGGCRPAPSPDDKITARDDADFEQWIAERTPALAPADVRELNDARQTIRYKTMEAHPGQSSRELSDAVYAEIEGKTRRELLIVADELQIERFKTELANYQPLLEKYQGYGKEKFLSDDDKKDAAEGLEKIQRLMREHQERLDQFTQRLAELRQNSPASAK